MTVCVQETQLLDLIKREVGVSDNDTLLDLLNQYQEEIKEEHRQ